MTLLERAIALLGDVHTAGIATVATDGSPWASNLRYAVLPSHGLRLAVLTDPSSTHVQHWTANPTVALSIFALPDTPLRVVRGLQMRGRASLDGDGEGAEAFQERFADMTVTAGPQHLYVIEVGWLRLVDRTATPAISEITLETPV